MSVDLSRVHEYVRIRDFKLTNNFRLYEMLASDTAQAHGIDNTPNEDELENIREGAIHLQSIRLFLAEEFGEVIQIEVTSGFRSDDLNEAVGGSKTSDHRDGLAFDVRFRRKSSGTYLDPVRVTRALEERGKPWDQIILYPGQVRLHIGFGPAMRKQIRHATGDGQYPFGYPPN